MTGSRSRSSLGVAAVRPARGRGGLDRIRGAGRRRSRSLRPHHAVGDPAAPAARPSRDLGGDPVTAGATRAPHRALGFTTASSFRRGEPIVPIYRRARGRRLNPEVHHEPHRRGCAQSIATCAARYARRRVGQGAIVISSSRQLAQGRATSAWRGQCALCPDATIGAAIASRRRRTHVPSTVISASRRSARPAARGGRH
jgi:hypothetical protein